MKNIVYPLVVVNVIGDSQYGKYSYFQVVDMNNIVIIETFTENTAREIQDNLNKLHKDFNSANLAGCNIGANQNERGWQPE